MKQALTKCAVKESNLQPITSYSRGVIGLGRNFPAAARSGKPDSLRTAPEPQNRNDNKPATRPYRNRPLASLFPYAGMGA